MELRDYAFLACGLLYHKINNDVGIVQRNMDSKELNAQQCAVSIATRTQNTQKEPNELSYKLIT